MYCLWKANLQFRGLGRRARASSQLLFVVPRLEICRRGKSEQDPRPSRVSTCDTFKVSTESYSDLVALGPRWHVRESDLPPARALLARAVGEGRRCHSRLNRHCCFLPAQRTAALARFAQGTDPSPARTAMPTARTAQNGRVPESAAKERTFAVPHYADGAEPDHLPLWPSLRGSQTALFRPVAVATGDRRLRVRTNVGDEARTESEMAKGLKAEQVKEETANGRGHHGNGVANGKATNGHVATAAEETAGTNGFIASLLGRGNKAVSTPPASQPSSNGSSVAPSPGRNSIRGKRYSGIIHANGVHRECFSDDGVTMVVESVAEKVAGIGFSVNGEPSPPLTPSPGLTETIDGSTYNGPLFRLPLPKNGLAYAPPPPPKSHLTFLNQRMDRPLVALALHSGLHYFTSRFIVPRLATGHLTAKDRVYLPEKLPSTVNAAFVGCLALYSVLKRGLFWGQGVDKINSWSDEVDLMFAGHLGFTLYDSYGGCNRECAVR